MMGNVLPALRSVLLGVGLAAAFAAAQAEAAEVPESDDPIVLAINEWTGQHITTHIAGHILKRMGYNVEFVTASYFPQFAATLARSASRKSKPGGIRSTSRSSARAFPTGRP